MAIVDLRTRLSNNWKECCLHDKSVDSLVYSSDVVNNIDCPTTIELKVGKICIKPGDSKTYKIDDSGLKIRPKESWIIYTEQILYIPLNVFGVVTGKGNYIFQGCFISTGKIDPGFKGNLKIGFYNGSNKTITLKKGDKFATVFFLTMQAVLDTPLKEYQNSPNPTTSTIRWWQKCEDYIISNWMQLLTMIIALPPSIYWLIKLISNMLS